jgi:diacylglycerol kinase (ATP)
MNDMKNLSFAARLRFAIAGLAYAVTAERSIRTQLLAVLVVLGALLYWRPAPVWWALVLLVSTAVLAAELLNTALERLADLLHPQQHPQIRVVKDCAAAAVLVLSLGALCVAAALAVSLWRAR